MADPEAKPELGVTRSEIAAIVKRVEELEKIAEQVKAFTGAKPPASDPAKKKSWWIS